MNWSLVCASLALYLVCGVAVAEGSTREAAQQFTGPERRRMLSGAVYLNIVVLWALYFVIAIYRYHIKGECRHGKS